MTCCCSSEDTFLSSLNRSTRVGPSAYTVTYTYSVRRSGEGRELGGVAKRSGTAPAGALSSPWRAAISCLCSNKLLGLNYINSLSLASSWSILPGP